MKWIQVEHWLSVNPFVPNAPFQQQMKTSEDFRGWRKGACGSKWVNFICYFNHQSTECGENGQNLHNVVQHVEEGCERDLENVTAHKQNMVVSIAFILIVFKKKVLQYISTESRNAILILAKVFSFIFYDFFYRNYLSKFEVHIIVITNFNLFCLTLYLPTPQNDQTHSNNPSVNSQRIV